jgi:uroporphyrin-III C-methyltransferase/precorrin-2 dehydrogenase/sirohydrochlorin ferrochelatase
MPSLPLFLHVEGTPVLVVGGGRAAYLKLRALFRAGAEVTVIAKALSPRVAALVARHPSCVVRLRPATRRDIVARYRLVFPLTDDEAVNASLTAAARAKRIWVGGSGDPARADFAFGATVDHGGIRLAVSTGGRSPALGRRLAQRLKATLAELLRADALAGLPDRQRTRTLVPDPRRRRARLDRAARQALTGR